MYLLPLSYSERCKPRQVISIAEVSSFLYERQSNTAASSTQSPIVLLRKTNARLMSIHAEFVGRIVVGRQNVLVPTT